MTQRFLFVTLTVAVVATGGCATPDPDPPALPPASPPASDARTLPIPGDDPPAPVGVASGSLTWDAPDAWIEVPPSNSMRHTQYRLTGDAGDAELVVFYFGPGQGGDPRANAERWAGQFLQPDGGDPREAMTIESMAGDGTLLHVVEVTGTYTGGMSTGVAPPEPIEDAMLLGGIVEGGDAPWFFKLTGPQETVEAAEADFEAMLRSLRQGAAPVTEG